MNVAGEFRTDDDTVSGKAFDARLTRRMLRYVRPYRGKFAAAVAASLAIVVLDLYSVEVVKQTIDGPLRNAIRAPDGGGGIDAVAGELAFLSALVFGLIVAAAALRVLQVRWINRVAQGAMRDLRVQVFDHVHRQALRFFDRNPVGRLVTRVVHDVESLSEMLTSGLDVVFVDLVRLLAIVVWLLLIHWKLALVCFTVLPVLMVTTRVFQRWSRNAFRVVRERVAAVNSTLQESVQGVRVIQAFVQEPKISALYAQRNARLMDAHISTVKNFALFFPVTQLLSAGGKGLLIWYGGLAITGGELTFGELTQFVLYLELFFQPIRDLAEQFNVLQGSMASAERLFRLLDRQPELVSPENPFVPGRLGGEIEFDHVGFEYEAGRPVLKDVTFHVEAGESVALVGATGAGKTTVASLATRLYDPSAGTVRVDGRDVREFDLHALRRSIAVVPQDVFLFAGTVEDNLRMGDPSLRREDLLEACRAVGADRLLSRLPQGLDSPVAERGARFSVGERQLLALARALAQDPAVLVLDEATSSVDSETEHLVQRALARLQEGRTTLVIAHRLSTIRRCDRILVFHHGELREQGTHEELLAADGIYATLHRLQFAA